MWLRSQKEKKKQEEQKRRDDQQLRVKQVVKWELTISPPPFSGLGTGCEQLSTNTGGVK